MTFVFFVIFSFTFSGSRRKVSGSTSARTGFALLYTIVLIVAMKVKAGAMTSSRHQRRQEPGPLAGHQDTAHPTGEAAHSSGQVG